MHTLPPSPALSACDSLANIEDLGAFLEAQGMLSHWPTPPFKDISIVTETEICVSEDEEVIDAVESECPPSPSQKSDDVPLDLGLHTATVLTKLASTGYEPSDVDIDMVEAILDRSRLPLEIIAVAFNILDALNCNSLPVESFDSAPNDLLVVCALRLASSYMLDHAPSILAWSSEACAKTWTKRRIERTSIQVLCALDWRLHRFGSPQAIESAVSRLMPARLTSLKVNTLPCDDEEDSQRSNTESCGQSDTATIVQLGCHEGCPNRMFMR